MLEIRTRNQSQQLFTSAMSAAWRNRSQLHDPSVWLLRDPEAEEKMLRDIDIAHAVGYRRHLIAGRNWSITPRVESSPRAPMAVAVATELVDCVKHFTEARVNLARAFFSGARFAKIHGEHRELTIGDGRPRVWWVPTKFEDLDKRMFRVVPHTDETTGEITAVFEKWHVGRARFEVMSVDDALTTVRHVYQDDQAQLGHGRSLREALGWWWYAKTHVFQDSLEAIDRFAQGMLAVKVNGVRDAQSQEPNSEVIEKWTRVLEDMRSRNVLVYDAEDEVEVIDMSGQGWQLLGEMRQELRSSIFTLILGANLTTSADGGGSYALAEIQENSTEALVQFDRSALEETLTDDLLGAIWHRNYPNLVELGVAEEKPRFSITQEKKQDPKERAEVAAVLNGMGVQLSLEDVLEQTGFRAPESGEAVIEGSTAPDPSMFGGFPPPMPSGAFAK